MEVGKGGPYIPGENKGTRQDSDPVPGRVCVQSPCHQLQPAWLHSQIGQGARDFLGFLGPPRPSVSDVRSWKCPLDPEPGCLFCLHFHARVGLQTPHPTPLGDKSQLSHACSGFTCLGSSRGGSVPALRVMWASHSWAGLYLCSQTLPPSRALPVTPITCGPQGWRRGRELAARETG